MQTIDLYRFSPGADSTLGILMADGLQMFTCEDEYRAEKVEGETRIPAGTYPIKLRTDGGMHPKYAARYPFHKGMLWLQDVPGFTYVYIHTGNNDDHSEGCLLVGYGSERDVGQGGGFITRSREAYADLYQKVVASAEQEKLQIVIHDQIV